MTATLDQHYTAILAALNVAGSRKAYRMGDPAIVSEAADTYTEVIISRRFGGIARMDSTLDSTLHRATARYVSKSATNAGVQQSKARGSLEYAVLTIGGLSTTPVQFETEDPIGPDDGWFSGADDFTYAL